VPLHRTLLGCWRISINEIPAVQALLRQLGLEQALLTVDAMHCQKNV
jgi:predicted transposase YbfD/YdcC